MSVDLLSEPPCFHNKNIILYYPYFANTFLLNHSIKYKGLLGAGVDSEIIRWDKDILIQTLMKEKESAREVLIFFATDRLLDSATISSINIDENIEKIEFSFYQPRFVFIPFSIEAYRLCYAEKNFEKHSLLIDGFNSNLTNIPSFSDERLSSYLKKFRLSSTIFSDTSKEAEFLLERIKERGFFNINVNQPELKLLYYGAPYSIYLLNQYPEFLPIRIDFLNPNEDEKFKNLFDTKNIIYCKLRKDCKFKDKCIIKEKIKNFHIDIFDQAKENPRSLADIYYRFVQENTEQIPFHIFKNVDCFTKAITYHHKYSDRTIDSKTKAFTSSLALLTSNKHPEDYISYSKSYSSFKENALAYFILLIYHYILKRELIKDLFFKEIAISLMNKAFLNGKYYYLFQNIIKTLYLKFNKEIENVPNPIKNFKAEYGLTSTENNLIFSQFKSDIIDEVNKRINDLEPNNTFANLLIALSFDMGMNDFASIPELIEEHEIEYTIMEIYDIKNAIYNKSDNSFLFKKEEKTKLKKIKLAREKRTKKSLEQSIVKPDISKLKNIPYGNDNRVK
jgi:hypothetical protein